MSSGRWSRRWIRRMWPFNPIRDGSIGKPSPGSGRERDRPAGKAIWPVLALGLILSFLPGSAPEALARPEGPLSWPWALRAPVVNEERPLRAAQSRSYRNLTPEERAERERRWRSLPPEKRQEYRRRMEKFNRLPAEDRQLFRRRHQQLQKLSPQERRRMEQQLERWDRLSPQERDKIKRRFHNRLWVPGGRGGVG